MQYIGCSAWMDVIRTYYDIRGAKVNKAVQYGGSVVISKQSIDARLGQVRHGGAGGAQRCRRGIEGWAGIVG